MKQRPRNGQTPRPSSNNRKPFGSRPGAPAFRKRERDDTAETRTERPARTGKSFTPRGDAKPARSRGAASAEEKSARPQRAGKPFGFRNSSNETRDRPGRNARSEEKPSFAGRGEKSFNADRGANRRRDHAQESGAEKKSWHPERTGNPFGRTGTSTRRDKPRDEASTERKFSRPAGKGKFFGNRAASSRDDDRPRDTTRRAGDFKYKNARPFTKPALAPPPAAAAAKVSREGILLWGMHAVREALLNPRRRCINLWATDATYDAVAELVATANASGLQRPIPARAERDTLSQMLPPSTVHQGIVLEAALLPEMTLGEVFQAETAPDLVIVLDQVTDPHNIGAILRSAAAFGAGAVIMTERNAPTTTGVMAKTASGAAEHVPQIHVVNLSRALLELQQAGFWCVGLAEEGARDLAALDLSGKTALVFGAEGDGLRRLTRENCDELARLPTGGAIGSLNVSNAAAVALYEVRRQKSKFG